MNRLLPPYCVPQNRRDSRAALVPGIRHAVDQWRNEGYPGATDTTRRLLQYWFEHDHKLKHGRRHQEFGYYFCQREAIETLVYLYEVRQLRSLYELARNFPPERPFLIQPGEDLFARYVFKMATGSGKTKVMSLAIVWAYYNAIFEPNSPLPRTFLLVAPNVIVYERLRVDFADGRIFSQDPLIPPEWHGDWQMTVVLRDSPTSPSTLGAVFLTNIQRLYDAPEDRAARNESPEMTAVLGSPVRESATTSGQALRDVVVRRGELMILNDEGHHLHNDDLEWHRVIVGLHERLQSQQAGGLAGQLDFTATPKHQNGALFREIIVDYPIAQAVEDGIVKRPIMGELTGVIEQSSDRASVKYRDRLTAGIRKWREFWDRFQETGKKPVLFIMAENTAAADDIYDWLETQPDFTGQVLNIHTNRTGQIAETRSNEALIDQLRKAARQVDSDDNPYRAIVSVLMLREGWDVRNVVVIVPLRPYTARAQILPEQTLGRGLRLMNLPASGIIEQVIVIEHEAFKPFWSNELEEEGLDIEWKPVDLVRPDFHSIYVDRSRLEYDIEVPLLSPALVTSTAGLESFGLDDIDPIRVSPPQPSLIREDTFGYTGREMLTLHVVEQHEIERDFPADPVGFTSVMCGLIQRECRLTGQFHLLAGLIKEYIENVLFGSPFNMEEDFVLIRLNKPDAKRAIFEAFVKAIRELTIQPQVVRPTGESLRFSDVPGYEWSKPVYQGDRTVFNLVACDNQFEVTFASFLDHRAKDVAAYARNTLNTHFSLEYQNSTGAIRLYYPDFIVKLLSGEMWLVETKGVEDIEVAHKDARAVQWCKDVSALSGVPWEYVKVPYGLFQGSTAGSFMDLVEEIGVK